MLRPRWFELSWVDKGVSVIGLIVGSAGIFVIAFLTNHGFSIQGGSNFDITTVMILAIASILFLVPPLSALCLLLLPLKDEQRGILSFVSLIVSIFAALPVYIVFFVVYCSAIRSSCT